MPSEPIAAALAALSSGQRPEVAAAVAGRWASLTKPEGSLGRLEEVVSQIAQIQNTPQPRWERLGLYVFCGDHGVTAENVSAYPAEVTPQMVRNFLRGGAAISVLCRQQGIESIVVDAGVNAPAEPGVVDLKVTPGTRNFARGAALTRAEATQAVNDGVELALEAAGRFDAVGVGEMGIGNTTCAAALLCAFSGLPPAEVVGRGTGVDDEGLARKRHVIESALAVHRPNRTDPLGVLAAIGGCEVAMLTGFLLGAASRSLPVMLDGFITGASAVVARAFHPWALSSSLYSHRSAERGHARMLEFLGARPLLDLDLRLGEGTGAALAMGVVASAMRLYREMATFAEAQVAERQL